MTRIRKRLLNTNSVKVTESLLYRLQETEAKLKSSYACQAYDEEKKVTSRMKSNVKAFFAYGRARQKTKARVGPFLDPETGVPNPDPDFAAETLSAQYSSVFSQPRPEYTVTDVKEFFSEGTLQWRQQHEGRPVLDDILFSEEDIIKACLELKPNSSPGPDGVPASLLRNACKELSVPLRILWRGSLDKGVIPADLLLVQISPIHKGGSRGLPGNYRPVALTSHVTKTFERVVRKALVEHLESNSLLPNGQHGFRKSRSCLTQLLTYWERLLEELELGNGVDSVYTDFAKAFDKCETGVLLHRLKECGVRGKVGEWLASFLDPSVRMQSVGVQGRLSSLIPVTSGVPQGTVLGPVLFLVHLMGIADSISTETSVSSFADDTRLLRGIKSEDDCKLLQKDLDNLYEWANEVGMVFNAGKFEILRFWPDTDRKPDLGYTAPDGSIIAEKQSLRDLGVMVDSDLSFRSQIESAVRSGSQMAGWALRTFRGRGMELMMTVLRSLVQPRLDYCCQLWSPRDQTSIKKIENVQRQFVNQIREKSLEGLNYWDKLSTLGLYSQERRRERHQICFLWKVSQGLVSGYDVQWTNSERRGRTIVQPPYKHSAPAKVRSAREKSLGVHGARIFNLLPQYLRDENSGDYALFKNHLDLYLQTVPDQPSTPGLSRAAASNSLVDQIPLMLSGN